MRELIARELKEPLQEVCHDGTQCDCKLLTISTHSDGCSDHIVIGESDDYSTFGHEIERLAQIVSDERRQPSLLNDLRCVEANDVLGTLGTSALAAIPTELPPT